MATHQGWQAEWILWESCLRSIRRSKRSLCLHDRPHEVNCIAETGRLRKLLVRVLRDKNKSKNAVRFDLMTFFPAVMFRMILCLHCPSVGGRYYELPLSSPCNMIKSITTPIYLIQEDHAPTRLLNVHGK